MTTFADDFNRADSTNLGAGWVEVSGDWSIISNQLSSGNAGGTILLRAATAMASNDNFAQVTIAATTAASQGVACRTNINLSTGYLWRNNGTSWDLFTLGTFTLLATYAAAAAPGDVAKVQAVGSTIKAFVNGVERASVTDTTYATGTGVGLRADSVSALRFDDFSAGDVGGASTVNGTIDQAYGGLGGGVTATREVAGAVGQAYGGLGGGASGTREAIGAAAQAYGGLSGGVSALREVPAAAAQSFAGLGGGAAGVRETAGTIAFGGGPLVAGITVPSESAATEAPTTTQVVQAWLRQFAGFPNSSTTVPAPDSWMSSPGFWVRIAGVVGGGSGLDVPEQLPVVQIEVVAAARAAAGAKSTSRKIPRGRAESKMQEICNRTFSTPAGLDLTLPDYMRPVWLETIYPVSAVRELPDPSLNFARYSADIFVGWIERNPVG